MPEQPSTTSTYDSPFRLLAIIAASVFVSEALVMIVLLVLPALPHAVAVPLDATLVTILIYPILHRFVVHPMTLHISERRQAEAALRRIQDDLELLVQQRTAELAQANETLRIQVMERQRAGEELRSALDLVQQRQSEMVGLLAGARAVLEYRDFREVAKAIFEACRGTIRAAAGYVALPTADRSSETLAFSNLGEWTKIQAAVLPMPLVGLRQQAYTIGKTLYTNEGDGGEYGQPLPGGHPILRNFLVAPMIIRGFVVGTLGLANKSGGFTDDDIRLATAFAELAAVGVLNSQTIELLESSERRFRTLAQATFEGITISEGGIIREANEQFAQMYGYKLSEILGKPIQDFLAPQDHERMQIAITSDEKHSGEYTGRRKDGSVFLLEVQAYSVEQNGRMVRVAALRDITKRKYADQMLRENEEWLRLAFDASELGRWRFSVATGMIHFDARARVHTGSSANDVSLTEALASIHPDDRERLQQDMASILDPTSDGRYAAEYRVTWPEGEIRWLGVQARVYFEGEGTTRQPVLAVGISQDITTRKRMEQALHENRRDLDRAQEVGQIGSWRLDVRRNVLTWSDENHRIFGVPKNTPLTYETFLGTVHPDDREYVDRQWTAGLAGESYDIEHRIIVDGVVKWVREKAYLEFDQGGVLLGGFGITQDITARKQAEERITWLASFPELNPSPVVEVDLAGHIHYLNPAAQRLLPDLQATGQRHPWLTNLELLRQKLQTDSTTMLTREIALSDAIYQQTLTYIPNSQRVRIYSLDITARRRAEEQLRLLSAALEATVNGVAVTDREGQILWVNPAFTTLTGYSREEVTGQTPRVLKSGQHHGEFYRELWRTILSGKPWSGEIVNRRKDGALYTEKMTITPVRVSGQEITHFVAIKEDITARKQMEEQLRHNQVLLEQRVLERTVELASANNALRLQSAALAAAANGILITDRQGDIQWCNPAFTQITGYASEEILGQNPRLLKSSDQPPQFYQRMWETILSGQVWRGELTNRRKDGSVYVEEQTISPVLNEIGEIANFVAVKQDVTERKRAENRLKQQNRELLELSSAEHRARQVAETLSAASLALTQSLDLETVMEALLDYLYQLVPYDSANIMLLEAEERLVVRAARGYEKWTDSQLTRMISFDAHSNQILRELLSAQKSVLIPETSTDPDWNTRLGAEHVRSWIGVPIIAGGHVIGVYSLDKTTPDFFTFEHVQLTEALAGQAAVAMQNAWLFDQLRAGRERLQSLSRRLVEVQEAERHYVARELHDEAGQALTSLVYGLGELEHEADPEQRMGQLTELKKITHDVLENLHRLAMDLRPASLDFLGLVPALNQYVTATGERYGLNAQFKAVGLADERLPAVLETALYRIVQEALTNVIRHARATRIDVLLERRDDQVVLVVEDNGHGFEADLAHQAEAGHLGLIGMQERAEMLEGSLVIESSPGSGTTIVVEVPHAHSDSHRG
jgi:PAS domain S-box-containing protein